MQLYSGTVQDFSRSLDSDRLIPEMETAFARQMLYRPSPSEITSWSASLPVFREDLIEQTSRVRGSFLSGFFHYPPVAWTP
jgi:hypothetical protein